MKKTQKVSMKWVWKNDWTIFIENSAIIPLSNMKIRRCNRIGFQRFQRPAKLRRALILRRRKSRKKAPDLICLLSPRFQVNSRRL